MKRVYAADYAKARATILNALLPAVAPGATLRTICPLCEGGEGGETSLALTASSDGLSGAWFCHRASCGFKGTTIRRDSGSNNPHASAFEARLMEEELLPLEAVGGALRARVDRACPHRAAELYVAGLRDDPTALAFANRDIFNRLMGYVVKRYRPDGSKRVETYRHHAGPVYAYYEHPNPATPERLVLVEDHLSALSAVFRGEIRYAVALCGTNLGPELLTTLKTWFGELPWAVALDPDATTQSLQMALMLRQEHDIHARPLLLGRDLKDMTDAEVKLALWGHA